jgi:hypothetical protein
MINYNIDENNFKTADLWELMGVYFVKLFLYTQLRLYFLWYLNDILDL